MGKIFVEVRSITSYIHWNLMYRIPKVIRMFNKKCGLSKRTTYKNIIIIREETGREILILRIDYNRKGKSFAEIIAMYDMVYSILKYCCIKFTMKYDFKNIKNLDDTNIPKIIKEFLIYGTNPEEYVVSDPPVVINKFYFYTYL